MDNLLSIYLHNMLSSTQESNMYVNGGSEEEWMNRLADAMIPYLDASGNINLYHVKRGAI